MRRRAGRCSRPAPNSSPKRLTAPLRIPSKRSIAEPVSTYANALFRCRCGWRLDYRGGVVGCAATMNATRPLEPVRFLVFSASLRADSLNCRLAELAAVTIETNGGDVDRAAMRDFDVPSYNGDVQDSEG